MVIFKQSVKNANDVAYFTPTPRIIFVYVFSDIISFII